MSREDVHGWATLGVGLLLLGVVGFAILKLWRWFGAVSDRAAARAFAGCPAFSQPGPGLVEVVFHTYSGLLIFTNQREHRFFAAPDDARQILRRLHQFNLVWGFFAYGAVVIPLLSLCNYLVQSGRISRQAARLSA